MTTRTDTYRTALPTLAVRGLAPWPLSRLFALHRQRRALADLDSHLLSDIGLSEEEARDEAKRPVWDVPDTWRR